MGRKRNLITGESMMTEGNALRHYLTKGRKALESGDYDRMRAVWNEASGVTDSSPCYKCPHDDIGYCGLRHSNIREQEKFAAYCFPSVLAWWEYQLNEKFWKKRK